MKTELYRKADVETDVPSSDEVEAYKDARAIRQQRLKNAGFYDRASAESAADGYKSKLEMAEALYGELDGKELKTWQRFLPTVTSRGSFTFDEVSEEALDAIIEAREFECFDRIDVWTPEGNTFLGIVASTVDAAQEKVNKLVASIDPMAVGVICDADGTEHYYPIARWGESLLPFKDIKRQVGRTRTKLRLVFGVLPFILFMLGVSAFYNGIVNYGYGQMVLGSLIAILISFLVLGVIALFVTIIDDLS